MKTFSFVNGDKIPVIGLGTWLSNPKEVYNAVIDAIKTGYRHIDCAYIYGNEKEIGSALNYIFKERMVKREDIFITSKLWNSDHSPERIEIALKRSLENLQLDYLDLYLMHWPIAFQTGKENASSAEDLISLNEIPLSITWEAMSKMKKAGLTKHIGVSNFNISKLERLIKDTNVNPEMNQVELHPYLQQNDLLDYCHKSNILVTAYSPLGGKTLKSSNTPSKEEIIMKIAKKHNCSPTQVLLAWGIKRNTIVIPKSVNPQRIKDNFDSLNISLDDLDMEEISTLERNGRMSTGSFAVFSDGPYNLKNIWNE